MGKQLTPTQGSYKSLDRQVPGRAGQSRPAGWSADHRSHPHPRRHARSARPRPASRSTRRGRRGRRGRRAAQGLPADRVTIRGRRNNRLLTRRPARRHRLDGAGPTGQNLVADRVRLSRTSHQPESGPLQGTHLHRLAPPRPPHHRRSPRRELHVAVDNYATQKHLAVRADSSLARG